MFTHNTDIVYTVWGKEQLGSFHFKGGKAGYFTLFWLKGGIPIFLQITWFFLNAVLLLYLKLFTCLDITTILK